MIFAIARLIIAVINQQPTPVGSEMEVPPSDWKPQLGRGEEDKSETYLLPALQSSWRVRFGRRSSTAAAGEELKAENRCHSQWADTSVECFALKLRCLVILQ